MEISVVVPSYKCSECIEELYKRLTATFQKMKIDDYEVVFVNDASPHNDWEIIESLCAKDHKVKGINLTRNFGQHYAITAGVDYVKGKYIVVMDCDLQDQPEEIEKLYNKIKEGYSVVYAGRFKRRDSFFKKLFSKMFAVFVGYMTGHKKNSAIANFSIVEMKVIKEIRKMREQNRGYFLFLQWQGYKSTVVGVEHASRSLGKSSYNFRKAVHLAVDIAVSHSNKPLQMFVEFGFTISFVSFVIGIIFIIRYFLKLGPVEGWTSLMVSLFFIGGLILSNLGIIGLYVGKIFDETKKRPLYLVQDTINL